MKLFRRKKRESLSELQGVPHGTFRCDVCKFVQPLVCLCSSVVDGLDNPPKVYTLCGICAIWLSFGELRFPQGLCFNFSEEQREKIEALHKELEIKHKELKTVHEASISCAESGDAEAGLNLVYDFLGRIPNLNVLIQLRFRLLRDEIRELSDRLTRGEFVDPSEIEKANN